MTKVTVRQRAYWKNVNRWRGPRIKRASKLLANTYTKEMTAVLELGVKGISVNRWMRVLERIWRMTFEDWVTSPVSKKADDESSWTAKISRQVRTWVKEKAEKLTETSKKVLEKIYSAGGDVSQKIKDQYTRWRGPRASSQARDIVTAASSHALVEEAKKTRRKPEFEWITMEDERVRPTHADQHGEIRPEGEKFTNSCRFPGDPEAPLSEVINCRCVLYPVLYPV